MGNIWNLLRLQIDNKTDILKTKSPKKMIRSIFRVVLLMAIVIVAVWFVVGRIMVLGITINAELIGIVLLVTQLVSLLFAIGNIINTLYLNKDNGMLICLPVTANQLFISKILLVYLKELAVNSAILVPIFASLGGIGHLGRSFYLSLIVYLFALPILPIILASFLSIIVMYIIKFLKNHPVISIVTILVLVAGCLAAYMILVGGIMDTFNIANDQLNTVTKINESIKEVGKHIPIYYQLGLAMVSFKNWWYIGLFVLICAVLLVVTMAIIRPFYFKIAMSSLENTTNSKDKPGKFRKVKPFVSLMEKEMKSIFRSPSEVFEYFLFTLLMPFIVYSYDKLMMSITVNQAGVNMIAGSHLMVVAILAMLSNIISASAISREGGNFYISKIIPVNYYTQVFAKLAFNVLFTLGSILVTMIVSFFIYPVWQILLGTLAVMLVSIGHATMSVDMDIKNPTKKFEGDGKSSTVSRSTPISIIYALLLGFLMGLVIIMMSSYKHAVVPYILLIVFGLLFLAYRIWILVLRINSAYDRIEM